MFARLAQNVEHRIYNSGITGSILERDVRSPSQLISDIQHNGHLSLTADLKIMWDYSGQSIAYKLMITGLLKGGATADINSSAENGGLGFPQANSKI